MDLPINVPAQHTAVIPRLAASVLMLRESSAGIEVFIQHRATTMDFAAGVVVYPGGRVDEQDRLAAEQISATLAEAHALRWAGTSVTQEGIEQAGMQAATLAVAACREVREETGAVLQPEQLRPWANWVTPMGSPKRFDTFFYVAALQPGQEPRHQTTEASSSQWITPAQLIAFSNSGQVRLMSPTRATLQAVAELGTLASVLSWTDEIRPVRPPVLHVSHVKNK